VTATLPAVEAPFGWRTEKGGGGEVPWIEVSLSNAVAAFTTRLGGVSEGDYAELNLGILTDDKPASVARNREIVAAATGRDPDGFAMGRQVHGSDVRIHDVRPRTSAYVRRGTDLVDADGHITGHAAVTPIVLVADCLPLVMSAPGAVAAIHCGWRGVAAGIVRVALERLCEVGGAAPPDVTAALGPGILPCCYEVGEEVVAAFSERGLGDAIDGRTLDIPRAIRLELTAAGVPVQAIADVRLCTSCNPDLFFSHRRDGPTGRQAGIAWLN
jgi:YfiH family protein